MSNTNEGTKSERRLRGSGGDSALRDLLVERLTTLNDRIKRVVPENGTLSSTTDALTDKIDDLCAYIEERNFKDFIYDVAAVVKRNPLPAVLGLTGIAVGMLVSARVATSDHGKKIAKHAAKALH